MSILTAVCPSFTFNWLNEYFAGFTGVSIGFVFGGKFVTWLEEKFEVLFENFSSSLLNWDWKKEDCGDGIGIEERLWLTRRIFSVKGMSWRNWKILPEVEEMNLNFWCFLNLCWHERRKCFRFSCFS